MNVTGESFEVLVRPVLELTMNYSVELKIDPGRLKTYILKFKGVNVSP